MIQAEGDMHKHVAFLLFILLFARVLAMLKLTFSPKAKKTKKYFKKRLTKVWSGDIISMLSARGQQDTSAWHLVRSLKIEQQREKYKAKSFYTEMYGSV